VFRTPLKKVKENEGRKKFSHLEKKKKGPQKKSFGLKRIFPSSIQNH